MPQAVTHEALSEFGHGFFGRTGGVSSGMYASLNCGLGSQDDRVAVLENRARVARQVLSCGGAMGLAWGAQRVPERSFGGHSAAIADGAAHRDDDKLRVTALVTGVGRGAAVGSFESVLTCHQVHSAVAVVVTAASAAGAQPRADALVTRTPGLVIGALAADCMPILLADPRAGVVAAAHAGWKGALAGIELSTIAAMETLGAERKNIRAVIGPCISQASYEVGPEFQAQFQSVDADYTRRFRVPSLGGRATFDLPGFMLDRLVRAGIASADWVGLCTYALPDAYFSFRRATHLREPDYGRQIAAICIPARL